MKNKELVFRFPPFLRWLSIIVAIFALVWALYFITHDFYTADKWFKKAVPFVVIFLVGNVLYKNLFTINSIKFTDYSVIFKPLLLKNIEIPFGDIKKIEYSIKAGKSIILTYEQGGKSKTLFIPRGIDKIIIVLTLIAENVPNIELDEFMKTVITTNK
ncbi:MAG: hypothetical protein JW794_00440 [Candidatus Cloacimonetes bacterium]|nr:hypothetical protein [Candidatus Cloacimonadota bacterium]